MDIVDVGCLLLEGDNLPPYPGVSKFALDISYLAPGHVPRRGREDAVLFFALLAPLFVRARQGTDP